MGIPVFETEDMFSDEECSTCCSCSQTSCHKSTTNTSSKSVSSSPSKCKGTSLPSDNTNMFVSDNTAYKDIVDNSKEVRIEANTSNLRFVGNNNLIRIALNTGDLIVIGNNTRLKVQTNHGHIRYTGNDGRIILGSESQQQLVDYIGCNGTLKIVNSMKFSKGKWSTADSNKNKPPAVSRKCCEAVKKTYCTKTNNSDKNTNNNNYDKLFVGNCDMKSPPAASDNNNTTTKASASRNSKPKEKSHSYGGSSSTREQSQWQTFNKLFNDARKSMPNLTSTQYETRYCRRGPVPTSIVQNIGNIVIANASNICISPYVRNIASNA